MAMRDLVTGGAACAVPGAPSSSSNPLGTLANALIGSSTKTQERLNELPGTTLTGPDGSHDYRTEGPLTTLPGSETEHQQFQYPNAQNSEFLHSFRLHEGLADAWKEVHGPTIPPHVHGSESQVQFAEFEQLYNNGVRSQLQPTLDGILSFGWARQNRIRAARRLSCRRWTSYTKETKDWYEAWRRLAWSRDSGQIDTTAGCSSSPKGTQRLRETR